MWICRSIYGVQLVQKGLFSELVLIDANKEKAEGEAMDLSHGRPFCSFHEDLRRLIMMISVTVR